MKLMEETNWQEKLKKKLEPKKAFLILAVVFITAILIISVFWQQILKQMTWKPLTIERPKTYESVLLSMIEGTIRSFAGKTFIIESGDKETQFYINANTRLFDKTGQKLSEESGFLFSDYLIPGQKVEILYVEYENIFLASEIWLK